METVSYSSVARKEPQPTTVFPKKNHAIVFPIVGDVTNEEYVNTISQFVPPTKIIFASRMSNGRMCIYFESLDTVDKFMQEQGEIQIRNHKITARRLINPLKRLTLSNVCPSIPHSVIEKELVDKIGITLRSSLSFVKAGYSNHELQHVFSFRRSVLFDPDFDNNTIPDSLVIKFEEEEYRIFLTTDSKMVCFTCKATGHPAKKCPNQQIIMEKQKEIQQLIDNTNKRTAPTSTNSALSSPSVENPTSRNTKKPTKKRKKVSDAPKASLSSSELNAVRNHIESHPLLTADPFIEKEDFIKLISNLKGSNNKIELAQKYTDDFENLTFLLEEIKPLLSGNAKRTVTCFQKTLAKEIDENPASASLDEISDSSNTY